MRHVIGSDKHEGFYIDVGAYHPVRFSNTQFFYLYGWRGINIEARPGSRKLFDEARPRDINLEVGVSSERGELTYYVIGEDSTMNSFSRDFLAEIKMLEHVQKEIKVPVGPLSELLDQHLPKQQAIDFMSVDVEGHDLSVLRSNNWNLYRPKFVVVEDEQIEQSQSDIVKFMKTIGYQVCIQNVIILGKINEYFFIDEAYLNS